jgi:hypothetical protein
MFVNTEEKSNNIFFFQRQEIWIYIILFQKANDPTCVANDYDK